MTGDDDGDGHGEISPGDRHRARSCTERPVPSLEEPTASRATLARRLRTVERALAGADGGIEGFDAGVETADTAGDAPDAADLDSVEDRLATLERAVRAVREHLVARDRARRTGDGLDSVERAVEALPDSGVTCTDDGDATGRLEAPGSAENGSEVGRDTASIDDESAVEWLDRVAGGGVTPPKSE